ncbi:MAG TPA: protein-L-isoaspartate(D-aspartate) O-methyltransferase [Planctomycetaceae bacterium]|nr:protein-L-isoaspartate(D-aspartate) O-methyltransferase [Planctomycetaceae bacterium]
MTTTSELRHQLREELELRGITDARVLDAIEETRRDLFVPEAIRAAAYEDSALPIGNGQTISQPYIVALMTQELELSGDEKILEVGTGSGYQAAILARLCRTVVTIERIPALSESTRRVLAEMGIGNVILLQGDGTLGNPEHAPYDRVIVTASAPSVPQPLYDQLKPGGRVVAPIGDESAQELVRVEKSDSGPKTTILCGCRFVKLIGEAGWQAP